MNASIDIDVPTRLCDVDVRARHGVSVRHGGGGLLAMYAAAGIKKLSATFAERWSVDDSSGDSGGAAGRKTGRAK